MSLSRRFVVASCAIAILGLVRGFGIDGRSSAMLSSTVAVRRGGRLAWRRSRIGRGNSVPVSAIQRQWRSDPRHRGSAFLRLEASLSTVPDTDLDLHDDHDNLQNVTTTATLPHFVTASAVDDPPDLRIENVSDQDQIEAFLQSRGIKSRPQGSWNVEDPVGWADNFGRRSPAYDQELREKVQLTAENEAYFDVSDMRVAGVTIVRTVEEARIVLERLNAADPNIFHACDTEVMDIDLKNLGPVGNGYVTCVSMYSGPDFDYGLGDGPGTSLWIDNLDDSFGVLQEFKEWFENPKHLKVWHNYGFDRHVLWNEGINVLGFGGDTMHMARLQDTSRTRGAGTGYSLEALTTELVGRRKKPMKEIFGVKRLRKDGSEGSLVDIPPVEVLQRDPSFRSQWIEYSTYDAQGTWMLRQELQKLLEGKPWYGDDDLYTYYMLHMRPFGEVLTDLERRGVRVAKDYLKSIEATARSDRDRHSDTFRKWAETQIGADGLAMNPASSTQLQTFLFGGYSEGDKTIVERERVFKVPREEIPQDSLDAYQKQEEEEKRKRKKDGGDEENAIQLEGMKAAQLKALCKEQGLKVSGKKSELIERLTDHFLNAPPEGSEPDAEIDSMSDADLHDALVARGLSGSGDRATMEDRLQKDIEFTRGVMSESEPANRDDYVALSGILEEAAKNGGALAEYLDELQIKSQKIPKYVEVKISGLGLTPIKATAGGSPSVTADVLRKLAGDPFADPPKWGTAYDKVGEEGCKALFSLCSIGSIDTMIANFLTSLQVLADQDDRVHCSLNLNTETGRLSSRRPNLQNQPALEKDKYKIRQAFEASPGHNLIVADYGQLELRILASMTNCRSMIDAFASGGDFHSRTALDMFDYVRQKVDAGECLLEWDYANGDPPKPLLKDLFASERRKAKTLNFSIAYGKTAHGLSQDWGVTPTEANEMLEAWYDARPEVREWQDRVKQCAKDHGFTMTLMRRYRDLPEAKMGNKKMLGHAMRASINTPIQGGAADIAMMAMTKINNNQKLKQLGWILLLQIHDEVILEGPEETAEEAFEEVIRDMQEPWVHGLEETKVPLLVDGSYTHKNWYEAK